MLVAVPRILVTNDDGIDSVGLHILARAMRDHGDVVVAAPDGEYSGSAASLGALHIIHPEIRRATIEGIDETWTLNGPPGLCAMLARLGAFGHVDLVVSGINPGANVGRAVYHSGTVGAVLTARNGGVSGVAVSQAVAGFGVEGQGWDEMIADQQWDAAAHVGRVVVGAVLASEVGDPVVVNVNVPNLPVARIRRWRHASIGLLPPRAIARCRLEPVAGRDGAFAVRMEWGDEIELPPETDGGAIERDELTISYLSRIVAEPRSDLPGVDAALDDLLTSTPTTSPSTLPR
jgi:5'-nucleotidase